MEYYKLFRAPGFRAKDSLKLSKPLRRGSPSRAWNARYVSSLSSGFAIWDPRAFPWALVMGPFLIPVGSVLWALFCISYWGPSQGP